MEMYVSHPSITERKNCTAGFYYSNIGKRSKRNEMPRHINVGCRNAKKRK